MTVVPSVLACMLVQAVAAFFYVTSVLTFYGAVNNARGFSEDPSHDGNVLYIVFSVFTAVAGTCRLVMSFFLFVIIVVGFFFIIPAVDFESEIF